MQLGLLSSILAAVFVLAILFVSGGYLMADMSNNYGKATNSSLSVSAQMNETLAIIGSVSETVNQTSESESGIVSGITPYLGAINVIRALPSIAGAGISTFGIMGAEIGRIMNIGWIFTILFGLLVSIVVLYTAMMILNRGQVP